MNRYEFVVLASRRAHQLRAGCTPRLEGDHNTTTMAQMEVAAGRVMRLDASAPPVPAMADVSAAPADRAADVAAPAK